MKIDAPLIANSTIELRGQPLRTGQKLAAIVLQSNTTTGKALLSLAGGQLSVTSRQPLAAGSAIQLTVRDLGPPVVLGLTPSSGANTPARATMPTPVQTLISLLASRLGASNNAGVHGVSIAGKMPPAVENTATNQSTKVELPLNLRTVLPTLDSLLTTPRTTSPSGQTNKPSGEQLFAQTLIQLITRNSLPSLPANTEDRAGGRHGVADLKTQLKLAAQQLKMQATLSSAAKESGSASQNTKPSTGPSTPAQVAGPMSHQTGPAHANPTQSNLEQWIGRLEVSQLRSAIQQIQGQPTWVVDVPMMLGGQPRRFQIAIQEQAQEPHSETATAWRVDFSVDLPELGPLHGSLSLQSSDLTVRLYADEPQARVKLDESLEQLADHLRAASLTPKELSIYPGPPPNAVRERLSPSPRLDEHTTFRCQV